MTSIGRLCNGVSRPTRWSAPPSPIRVSYPFGSRTIEKRVNLSGRKWARIEVWDVAANGAYTPPVYLKGK